MQTILLTAAFAFAAAEKPAEAGANKSLDGNWTVIAFEKDGKAVGEPKDHQVKIEGNTITCNGRDGKAMMTMKVEFGPNGTVKVTDTTPGATADAGGAKAGVYVMTNDYLAVCVHADQAERPAGAAADTKPQGKSRCTVILRREAARPNP